MTHDVNAEKKSIVTYNLDNIGRKLPKTRPLIFGKDFNQHFLLFTHPIINNK